jgi:alkanesulfonate monooxygenase
MYTRPIELTDSLPISVRWGARTRIIAPAQSHKAWRVAHESFPKSRRGELADLLMTKVRDSVSLQQPSEIGSGPLTQRSQYWLGPFQGCQTFCPYLVGTYERTAVEISRRIAKGYRTFILDIQFWREELEHTGIRFQRAPKLTQDSMPVDLASQTAGRSL